MGNPLQDPRTPSDLAEIGQVIEIEEKISSFERLAGIVEADLLALEPDKLPPGWRDALVTGRLSFGFTGAQGGLPALEGRAEATIDAVCQRCLEPFGLPLSVELRCVFAAGQPPQADSDGYEFWELDEDVVRPLDVVEEALIMSLPLAAMHIDDASCKEPGAVTVRPAKTIQPFASLRAQMEDDN